MEFQASGLVVQRPAFQFENARSCIMNRGGFAQRQITRQLLHCWHRQAICFTLQGWTGMLPGPMKFAREDLMLDFFAITATVVFFLISLAYVRGCEKL